MNSEMRTKRAFLRVQLTNDGVPSNQGTIYAGLRGGGWGIGVAASRVYASGTRNRKSDESCISKWKVEILNRTRTNARSDLRFPLSTLRCRIRPISDFLSRRLAKPGAPQLPVRSFARAFARASGETAGC